MTPADRSGSMPSKRTSPSPERTMSYAAPAPVTSCNASGRRSHAASSRERSIGSPDGGSPVPAELSKLL